jgi:NIPSNAP
MIYELRIYRCVPGRQPALLSRFENETLRIWEKHGIRQAGFWTTLIGNSSQEITYMLACLGQHGRAREALGRFSRRSRMGRGGRQDGEGWPAR